MLKNLLVAFVSGLVGALAVVGLYGPSDKLGGTNYNRQIDFAEGISVAGTEIISSGRDIDVDDLQVDDDLVVTGLATVGETLAVTGNLTAGGASASSVASATLGESAATSTILFGSGSVAGAGVCFALVEGNSAQTQTRVWWQATSISPYIIRSTAKPTGCP